MRLARVVIRNHRSVWGVPLELRLAREVTAVVGPNRAGKSNVVRAVASALDPGIPVELDRDRPVRRPETRPEVDLSFTPEDEDGTGPVDAAVTWADSEERLVAVDPPDRAPGPPMGEGRILYCPPDMTLDGLLRRHADQLGDDEAVAEALRLELDRVIPGIGAVVVRSGQVTVEDTEGFPLSAASGLRVAGAVGLGRHLADRGVGLACTIIEQPEAWLHPAAQELVRDALRELAVATGAPVIVTTESPFILPRTAGSRVIAVAKDARGSTRFVGAARGDEPQAALLGGLLRDPGLGAVLDRAARLGEDAAGVLVVEGGTDEAYLRLAAEVLGRSGDLDRIAVLPAGGAMAAALQAIVLRAESDLGLLVVLDNDDPGRRAKDTLTGRFEFDNRRQVMSYAEVVPDHPLGVEAEDLFDWRLVGRFVEEHGSTAVRGQRILRVDEWHYDLTSSAKSAFVGWLEEHLEPAHAVRWGQFLDLVLERLGRAGGDPDGP